MSEIPDIDSALLGRYLAEECGPAERDAVEQWANADPSNGRELERMRELWSMSGPLASADVDVDAAWVSVRARLGVVDGVIPIQRPRTMIRWVAAAAILTGVVFASRYFMSSGPEEFLAGTDQMTYMLSDSSSIVLSPRSGLSVSMRETRKVELNGEAYFEVARDEARPFTVAAGEVTVTVLGTAFTVDAFDTSSTVTVSVREGRVQVMALSDSVILLGGDQARFNKASGQLELSTVPPSSLWGVRILEFSGAPMSEVVERLRTLYHVDIRLQNEAQGRCSLTATFDDEPIDLVLRVIAETFGFTVSQEDGVYQLIGDGC